MISINIFLVVVVVHLKLIYALPSLAYRSLLAFLPFFYIFLSYWYMYIRLASWRFHWHSNLLLHLFIRKICPHCLRIYEHLLGLLVNFPSDQFYFQLRRWLYLGQLVLWLTISISWYYGKFSPLLYHIQLELQELSYNAQLW